MAGQKTRIAVALAALTLLGVAGLRATSADRARAESAGPGVGGPVVLELFTSQGCASCPPADALLSRLGDTEGRTILPLAFHVDYWDGLGWTDPFAQSGWTARQEQYARAFRSTNLYTPQLIVNGRAGFVGSDGRRAAREIAAAARRTPPARVAITGVHIDRDTGAWAVTTEAEVLRPIEAERLEVLLALFENGLTTRVLRGENAGRTMPADYVVRSLVGAFDLPPAPGGSVIHTTAIAVAQEWKRPNLGVAAFVQDPATLAIYGASVVRP